MSLEKFGARSIATLDQGRVGVAIDQAIARAQRDCADFPGLDSPRVVTVSISIVPVLESKGMESCNVEVTVKESLPKRGRTFNMNATERGLFFNELSPDDADQLTLDQAKGPRLADVGAPSNTAGSKKEKTANAL